MIRAYSKEALLYTEFAAARAPGDVTGLTSMGKTHPRELRTALEILLNESSEESHMQCGRSGGRSSAGRAPEYGRSCSAGRRKGWYYSCVGSPVCSEQFTLEKAVYQAKITSSFPWTSGMAVRGDPDHSVTGKRS